MPTQAKPFMTIEEKLRNPLCEGAAIGFYTQRERMAKIRKYKLKLKNVSPTKKLIGRSRVARVKGRHNGRFCSKLELSKITEKSKFIDDGFYGIMSDEEIIIRNSEIDLYTSVGDMNNLVRYAIQ